MTPVLSSGSVLLLQPLSRLYAVTIDRMCCSFGFGDTGLVKCQLFCGRAMGPRQRRKPTDQLYDAYSLSPGGGSLACPVGGA